MLVLDENDIQLTNQFLVGEAIRESERTVEEVPDEVYLVSTVISPWHVYCIRIDGEWIFDSDRMEARFWEVDPALLDPLTNQ